MSLRTLSLSKTLLLLLVACHDGPEKFWETGLPPDSGSGDTDSAESAESDTAPADADGDGSPDGEDCAPDDANISPDAAETCDHVDNNCDGTVDEGVSTAIYPDLDGDGYGDVTATDGCAGEGLASGDDCDDTDPDIRPGATDIPLDGVDQDCDGSDGGTSVYVVDRYDGTVAELSAEDGGMLASLTGLGAMIGIARTEDGTLYVSRFDASILTEVSADLDSSADVVSSGLSGPHTLAWDPSTQTVLVGGFSSNLVHEYDPATGALSDLSAAVSQPVGVFRFPDDDVVYVTSRVDSALIALDSATGEELDRLSLPSASDTIAADGPDGLWIASGFSGALYHVDLTVPEVSVVASGLSYAFGICVAPDGGSVLVSEETDSDMLSVTASGATSVFSTALTSPWQCVTGVPYDGDGDGLWASYWGGTDCDDVDSDAGECAGGARWPG